ncbi:FIG00904791: hypothetical protein [Olavius algarvensis Delta 1 endosymbiont]|nr:FIG00904791: hypothetical protein [Olavius algarvensis Delta 1 endosymbiont]
MKWRKHGKIFDPTQHCLPNGCYEFAQSPQALVFDEFVRIYFSTRQKDPLNGKYLSHIAYIDMNMELNRIEHVSKNTVIDLGNLGCYDEHGIFPLNVLKRESTIFGYIGGWNRRVSVSVDTAIGLAISKDNGKYFKRIGNGPVLSSSPREPFLVGDPFVMNICGKFYMWYIFGVEWKRFTEDQEPDRIYKIGYALSDDGINWLKPEEGRPIISDRLGKDESQAMPTVINFGGRYHMFFCYRESFDFRKSPSRGYRIGYAYSYNLLEWIRDDRQVGIDVSEQGWDSDMMCYPRVFENNGKIYMLYNGNHFGRFGFGLAVLESEF